MRSTMRQGFSLLEISIVLTVVGLIVGGILVGKNLVRASEIRSVLEDLKQYRSAVQMFETQYNALPGDMKNATQFWGAVAGGTAVGVDATCVAYFDATQTPRTATCNGDGNGQIDSPSNFWSEPWLVWQHLANAGMVEGSYTGQGQSAYGTPQNNNPVVGSSSPKSKVNDLTYALRWINNITNAAHSFYFVGAYGNVFMVGQKTELDDVVMTAEEAFEIDSKLDDGLPGTGGVRSHKNLDRPNCATTDDPVTARYVVPTNIVGCNLLVNLKQ